MTLFGAAVSLETILDKIADKVGESGDNLFDDERVLVSLANDLDFDQNPVGESFLVITPRSFAAIEGFVAGGGNEKCGTNGTIEIDLWNRYEVDEALRDRYAMKDATYGILGKWQGVMASLQLYAPLNSANRGILIEPMRFIIWSVQPRRQKSPWLSIRSQWECKFIQDLS